MTDDQILLAAIRANPADDAPRLAYADWLEENAGDETCDCEHGWKVSRYRIAEMSPDEYGVPSCRCTRCSVTGCVPNNYAERAEFIRVQCALTRLLDGVPLHFHGALDMLFDPESTHDQQRKHEILEHQKREHNCFIACICRQEIERVIPHADYAIERDVQPENSDQNKTLLIYRRGFIDEVHCTLAQYLEHASAIAAQHPVQAWTITDMQILPMYTDVGAGQSDARYWSVPSSRLGNALRERSPLWKKIRNALAAYPGHFPDEQTGRTFLQRLLVEAARAK